MDLKQPPQYYWTTLFDQYQPSQSLSFVFVPLRSFVNYSIPGLDVIARMLDAQPLDGPSIQPWQLPTLLAGLLPDGGLPPSPFAFLTQLTSGWTYYDSSTRTGFTAVT